MGKRKERRLAALSNAGRRVKLDLFAEPSGELGGSNINGDAGGHIDSQQHDGLPNSPSSSGQQQNPLLLLGQYSDDEVDEGSSQGPNDAKVQSPMLNEEVNDSLDEGSKNLDNSVSVEFVVHNDGQQNTMPNYSSGDVEGCEKNESDDSGNLQKEVVSGDQIPVSENCDKQVITDTSLGWKMVMHEESQRYYYWNIETGETSWEVPQVLAQAAQLANNPICPTSIDDKTESAAVGIDNSNVPSAVIDTVATVTSGVSAETTGASDIEMGGHWSQMNGCSGECANEHQGSDVNERESIRSNALISISHGGDHSFVSNFSVEEQQSAIDFPSRLLKQSEDLLERLRSMKKSKGNLQAQDSLSRCLFEVEIRLSDIRSLSSYGMSLLPFWMHSDQQIKLLESVTNALLQTAKSAHDEVEDKHVSVSEVLSEQNGIGHKSEIDHNENKESVLTSAVSNGCQHDASAVVLNENNISTHAQHVPLSDSSGMETGVEVNTQVATINPEETTHKQVYTAGEDIDMDVDMEVEDMDTSGNTTGADVSVAKDLVQTDQPFQSNPVSVYHSLMPEDEFVVPPPPDDEWIPPPPPDNEQMPPPPPPDNEEIPPPPPGDPLAPSYLAPPAYAEQSLSYGQYSLTYPGASSEYYGQAAVEVPTSNIYGQVAVPSQLYYSAVANLYNENSQAMINPINPIAYYELPDGAGSKSIPVNNIIDSDVGGADRASSDVPSTSSGVNVPATVSVDDSVPLPPVTAEAAAGSATSSAVAKAQTKVVRSKKRSVAVGSSLKSNKKVSSLVDKWKAAKEELLEEEDEPESVYEVFERKRQREIEEWHAKQIASGEAKDNANFQPLGGDWRERVKRKRARAARESADTPQDTIGHNQQQSDLSELSKGLPSSWQAYWDETTKQVYYGNTVTSEATWTRPTG